MNKQAIIALIFLAITAFFVWQYFLPSFNEAMALRLETASWEAKLNDTQGLNEKLKELNKKYQAMSEVADRVLQALPVEEDVPGLLVQLESLSSRNGLILDSVVFGSPEDKKEKKASSAGGAKTLTADLSLSGNQSSLINFLKSVEGNLRLMDVAAVNFNAPEKEALSGQSFSVSLNIYYH